MDRGDVERLFHLLVAEEVLKEDLQVNKAGYTSAYVKVGKRAAYIGGKDRLGYPVNVFLGLPKEGYKIPVPGKKGAKGKKPRENIVQKLKLGPPKGKPIATGRQAFIGAQDSDDDDDNDEAVDEDEVRITNIIQKRINAVQKQKASTSRRHAKLRESEEEDGEWLDDGADDEDGGPDGGWRNEDDDNEFVVPDGEGEDTVDSSSDSDDAERGDEDNDSDIEMIPTKQKQEEWQAATQSVKAITRGVKDPTAELYEELKACVERVSPYMYDANAHQVLTAKQVSAEHDVAIPEGFEEILQMCAAICPTVSFENTQLLLVDDVEWVAYRLRKAFWRSRTSTRISTTLSAFSSRRSAASTSAEWTASSSMQQLLLAVQTRPRLLRRRRWRTLARRLRQRRNLPLLAPRRGR